MSKSSDIGYKGDKEKATKKGYKEKATKKGYKERIQRKDTKKSYIERCTNILPVDDLINTGVI